jgi:hypothetical protein
MMPDDLHDEWRRLTEHYAQMYDGELVRLAHQYADLTDVARQVLRDEMLKRGLGDPAKPDEVQQDSGRLRFERGFEIDGDASGSDVEDGERAHEYTWKTDLCECENEEQAWQISRVLDRAGIDCWVRDTGRGFVASSLDLTNIRIVVAADQLEEARKIIAQPIPQEIIDESQVEVPPYVIPTCPACGDPDPTLLEDEKANCWSCEVCGKEWTELEKPPAEQA